MQTSIKHLAIIMDGNGRWAQQRGLPRIAGHQNGVQAVLRIVEECVQLRLQVLTLYAFSSENWGRPQEEVGALMTLLLNFLSTQRANMQHQQIRLRVIGDLTKMSAEVQAALRKAQAETAANSGMTLVLALSYGGRDEILRACRQLGAALAQGNLTAPELDEERFTAFLDSHDLPDPDLLIRTSGEKRISNFLLWQLAYTELYFSDVLWPDFDRAELYKALEDYQQRCRRFGLIDNGDPNTSASQEES